MKLICFYTYLPCLAGIKGVEIYYFQNFREQTLSMMRHAATLMQIFAITQLGCGSKDFQKNLLKRTTKGNHWGSVDFIHGGYWNQDCGVFNGGYWNQDCGVFNGAIEIKIVGSSMGLLKSRLWGLQWGYWNKDYGGFNGAIEIKIVGSSMGGYWNQDCGVFNGGYWNHRLWGLQWGYWNQDCEVFNGAIEIKIVRSSMGLLKSRLWGLQWGLLKSRLWGLQWGYWNKDCGVFNGAIEIKIVEFSMGAIKIEIVGSSLKVRKISSLGFHLWGLVKSNLLGYHSRPWFMGLKCLESSWGSVMRISPSILPFIRLIDCLQINCAFDYHHLNVLLPIYR